ncbi:hypothetical protein PAXRUDRAFT_22346 [Paxillus rubicundulus Ve08.2h10]|uniref:Uncharacterized protein n=1 Tax=Paxillus rubicundulus Ve08.2h10 TaxID=930991 RepID=A0A0D0CNA0_9AGAM|nr:hypothetical protein PAXRUDRAFT_22346 [Paxillus rubicundulus Ve08.2h10]
MPPIWMLDDQRSNGEGRQMAKGHREAEGARDVCNPIMGTREKGQKGERARGSAAPSLDDKCCTRLNPPLPPYPTKYKANPRADSTTQMHTVKDTMRGPNGKIKGKKGGKGKQHERASGSTAPSSNGEYAVPDSTSPPPYPVQWRSTQTTEHVARGGAKIFEVER